MNTEKDDLLVYDEEEAVKFIRKNNPGLSLSDDEINYIIDLMYDYYESRGFLDEKSEEEVEIADDDLIEYAVANTRKDGIYKLSEEDITTVVQGELDYCDSLGVLKTDGKMKRLCIALLAIISSSLFLYPASRQRERRRSKLHPIGMQ